MSLDETRQIMADLQEIMTLLGKAEVKTQQITQYEGRADNSLRTFGKLERIALRWLVIAKKMNIPQNMKDAIDTISTYIVQLQMMQMSLNLLMSTNPLTVGAAAAGLFGSILSFSAMGSPIEGY